MSNKNTVIYNLQIEGLRGIAIILIAIYHIINRYLQVYYNVTIYWMNFWGTLGTTIFLLISSYYIVYNKNFKAPIRIGIKNFIFKIIRIWPSYCLSIILIFVITHVYYLEKRTVDFTVFVSNIFFANRFFGWDYVDGSHWYLSLLLSVSLIISIFQIIGKLNIPVVYMIWNILEILLSWIIEESSLFILGGPFVGTVCVGISIYYVTNEKNITKKKQIEWILVCILSLITTFYMRGLVSCIELLFGSGILIGCLQKKCKFIEVKLLILIGNASYTIYLIHQNISFVIQQYLNSKAGEYILTNALISLIVVFAFGFAIYYFFEKPIQKGIKSIIKN